MVSRVGTIMEAPSSAPRLARDFFKSNCWAAAAAPTWQAFAADNAVLQANLGNNTNSASAPAHSGQANGADNDDLHQNLLHEAAPALAHDEQASISASTTDQATETAANFDLQIPASVNKQAKDSATVQQQQAKGTQLDSTSNLLHEGKPLSEASAHEQQQASSQILSSPTHVTSSSIAAHIHSSIASNPGKCSNLAHTATPSSSTPSSSSAPSHPLSATPACSSLLAAPAANPPSCSKATPSPLRATALPWTPIAPKQQSIHCMLVGTILTPIRISSSSTLPSPCLQLPKTAEQSLALFSFDGDHLGVSAQQPRRCCHYCGQPPHSSAKLESSPQGCFPLRGRDVADVPNQAQVSVDPYKSSNRPRCKMKDADSTLFADEAETSQSKSSRRRCKKKQGHTDRKP